MHNSYTHFYFFHSFPFDFEFIHCFHVFVFDYYYQIAHITCYRCIHNTVLIAQLICTNSHTLLNFNHVFDIHIINLIAPCICKFEFEFEIGTVYNFQLNYYHFHHTHIQYICVWLSFPDWLVIGEIFTYDFYERGVQSIRFLVPKKWAEESSFSLTKLEIHSFVLIFFVQN